MTEGDASDYEKASELIGEAGAGGAATATIDIDGMLAERIEIRSVAYSEVSALLESVEATSAEASQQQQQAQQRSAAQRTEPQAQVGRALGKEAAGAASALKGAVGGAGKEFEVFVKSDLAAASAKRLVMPKLSVQDQLSDLEGIEEGVSEGVFDKRHMGIIAEEIRWLYAASMREDTKSLSEEQKELVALRNKKVMEIASGIGITPQGS